MNCRIVTRSFLHMPARPAAVRPCSLPFAARWRVLSSVSSFNRHQILTNAQTGWQKNIGFSLGAHSERSIAVPCRHYAEGVGMTITELRDRVIKVLQMFDKIDPNKVTLESHFMKDLGLDSLDVVEIVMAFEDEFGVEIDDEQAEKIFTANDAVEFMKTKLDMHSN